MTQILGLMDQIGTGRCPTCSFAKTLAEREQLTSRALSFSMSRSTRETITLVGGLLGLVGMAAVTLHVLNRSPQFSNFLQTLGHVAALVTVVALAFAIFQARDAKLTRDSLSTRSVGQFPNFLTDIVQVLERARSEIVILCDFPAYGRFSNADTWRAYSEAILSKSASDVRVSCVFLTPEARLDFSRKQFPEAAQSDLRWKQQLVARPFRDNLFSFLKRHNREVEIATISFETFLEILEIDDKLALRTTFRDAEIIVTADSMPLYFWIADRRMGVFSFPTYTGSKTEFGFSLLITS